MKGILATLMFLVPVVATASPVTYDFTGAVTGSNGIFSNLALDSTFSGTYTFDLAAATSETTYSTGSWIAESAAESGSLVFSTTAEVDGVTFASNPNASALLQSESGTEVSLHGSEGTSIVESSFSLTDPESTPTSSGLPPYQLTTYADGDGEISSPEGSVYYRIATWDGSPTDWNGTAPPVPLPGTAWLLLSGLGGFGVFARGLRLAACALQLLNHLKSRRPQAPA